MGKGNLYQYVNAILRRRAKANERAAEKTIVAQLKAYKLVSLKGTSGVKSPTISAAKTVTYSINRLGLTLTSIGQVVNDIEDIAEKQLTEEQLQDKLERRQRRRELDAESERIQENRFKNKTPKLKGSEKTKVAKGFSKGFGWLEEILAPFTTLAMQFASFILGTELLKWIQDPRNTEKLTEFIRKTAFVFQKFYDFSTWLTGSIMTTVDNLLGEEKTFAQRLTAFGQIALAISGIGALLTVGGMVGGGVSDWVDGPRPKKRVPITEGGKGKKKWWEFWRKPAEITGDVPKKKNWLGKLTDKIKDTFRIGTNITGDLIEGTKSNKRKIVDWLGDAVGNVRKWAFGDKITISGAEGNRGVFGKIGDWFSNQGKKIFGSKVTGGETGGILENIRKGFGDFITNTRTGTGNLINKGLESTKNIWDNIVESVTGTGKKIGEGLSDTGGSIWRNIKTGWGNFTDWGGKKIGQGVELGRTGIRMTNEFVGKQFENLKRFGTRVGQGLADIPAKLKGGWDSISNASKKWFTDTIRPTIDPILNPIVDYIRPKIDSFMRAIRETPLWRASTQFLESKGIKSFADAGQKIGKRAAAIIPWIGGLVNLAFAYDRLSQGDPWGATLETVAGILDFAGVSWPFSTALDAFLFARDFDVTGIRDTEDAIFNNLPLLGWVNRQISSMFDQLPNIGHIFNTLMGRENGLFDENTDFSEGEYDWSTDGVERHEKQYTSNGGKNQWWDFLDVFANEKSAPSTSTSTKTKVQNQNNEKKDDNRRRWWNPFTWGKKELGGIVEKPKEFFFGKIFKGVSKAVSGVVKGVSKAVGGVVNTVKEVVKNPVVQTVASFIPGVAPVMAAVNAVSSLASGDIMGAVTGGLSAATGGIFGGGIQDAVSGFMDSSIGQGIMGIGKGLMSGDIGGAISSGLGMIPGANNFLDGIVNSPIGEIAGKALSGDLAGAFSQGISMIPGMDSIKNSSVGQMLGSIMSGDIGGAIGTFASSINPDFGKAVGNIMSGGFNPMAMVGQLADHFGLKGALNAVMGGDYKSAITSLGTKLGIDPKVLGVFNETATAVTSNLGNQKDGISAQWAMQQQVEFMPIIVMLEKLAPMPVPVPINIGTNYVIASPSSAQVRVS